MTITRFRPAVMAAAGTMIVFSGVAQAQESFANLYDFGAPVSPTNLIAGPNGLIYGAADNGAFARGTVFQLTPPAATGESWNLTVLYTLTTSDGAAPAAITSGPGGVIIGSTTLGGPLNDGTIFELTPPASAGGSWTSQILHSFISFPGGARPTGNLAVDISGRIYGATLAGGIPSPNGGWGVVFELTPPTSPGGSWTENILHTFTGGVDGGLPYGGVILGPDGSLYGTTAKGGVSDLGTVFQVARPTTRGGTWPETVLHDFAGFADGATPQAGLLLGSNGALYGTTRVGGTAEAGFTGDGTVFELRPPATVGEAWTEQILYKFQPGFPTAGYYPAAPVVFGPNGGIYGTTCCGGTVYGVVFELQPPVSPGSPWTETILHTFTGGADSGSSYQGLLPGPGGFLYGSTTGIGTTGDSATIFVVKP